MHTVYLKYIGCVNSTANSAQWYVAVMQLLFCLKSCPWHIACYTQLVDISMPSTESQATFHAMCHCYVLLYSF